MEDAAKRGKEIAERLKSEEEKAERQLKFLLQRQKEIMLESRNQFWEDVENEQRQKNEKQEMNEKEEKNEKKEKEANKGKGGPSKGL
jgi:hypothetical protein